jgi:hypothetical protein
MGTYNPDAPVILGNEWAGIHEEDLLFDINQNTLEQGYTFTVPAGQSVPLDNVRCYVNPDSFSRPDGVFSESSLLAAVYPFGTEANAGTIQRVVIPVVSGATSGAALSTDWVIVDNLGSGVISPPTVPTGLQVAGAVYDQTSSNGISFFQPTTTNTSNFFGASFEFGVAPYAQMLNGKRILAVNVLFILDSNPGTDEIALTSATPMDVYLRFGSFLFSSFYGNGFSSPSVQRLGIGEVTRLWSNPAGFGNKPMPWNLAGLMNFDSGTALANKIGISFRRRINNIVTGGNYSLSYVALEVIYCEETRVAFGAVEPALDPTNGWQYGVQTIPMFQPGNYAAKPILGPGTYTVAVSAPLGKEGDNFSTVNLGYAPLNSMRTYYDLPTHFGRQVSKPFPIENAVGQQFAVESTSVLPQLSLHVTGAVNTPPSPYGHVYGRRAEVPVYGGTQATQLVDLTPASNGMVYSQVRAYVRRLGTTLGDLKLAVGPGAATISAPALDALPEIIDGWREVTLPLDVPFTVTGGTTIALTALDTQFQQQYTEDFEDNNVAGWVATAGTFTIDEWSHTGDYGARLVVVGSPTSTFARSPRQPVVAGQSYNVAGWFYATAITSNVSITIDWRTSRGALLSTSSASVTLAANTWTRVTVTATAPAGAGLAGMGPTLGSSPAAGTTIFFDDLVLSKNLGLNSISTRWEVLGVSAPAVTSLPVGSNAVPSRITPVPAAEQLGSATYNAPNGATDTLTWQSPFVSGAAVADATTDLVFLLSQQPPYVTASVQTADGTFESSPPAGWTPTSATLVRSSAQHHGGAFSGLMTVVGTPSGADTRAFAQVVPGQPYTATFWVYSVAGFATLQMCLDWLDPTGTFISENNSGNLVIPAATWTQVSVTATAPANASGVSYGPSLRSSPANGTQIFIDDADITGPGLKVGPATQALTAVLDCGTPPNCIPTGLTYNVVSWLSTAATGSAFAYYEIQRMDAVDPTFRTIAQLADANDTSLNDYEARIGVATTYRVAIVNDMGFVGLYASSLPTTIAAPGIGGRNVSEGILTFTSNMDQTGNSNLAYTPSWDGTPTEDVTFPEASRVKLQWEYGRDYLSQFMPTERGGEQFSRTLEVQNAAASGPQIENGFRSLRDLAWETLPYVCVRNEIGDRWFAAVTVPGGTFQRNRALQLAQVQITQVSTSPSIVTAV